MGGSSFGENPHLSNTYADLSLVCFLLLSRERPLAAPGRRTATAGPEKEGRTSSLVVLRELFQERTWPGTTSGPRETTSWKLFPSCHYYFTQTLKLQERENIYSLRSLGRQLFHVAMVMTEPKAKSTWKNLFLGWAGRTKSTDQFSLNHLVNVNHC